jgi:protein SCO1/2
MTRQNLVLAALATSVLLLGAIAAACGGGNSSSSPKSIDVGNSPYRGAIVSPALPKPSAVLTDTSNQPFDLQKQTQGYVTLLYFGYTHCPDACPQHMSNIEAALKQVAPDIAAKIRVVFVTTDPQRDTPAVLRTWLNLFNPQFIGLGGTTAQINDAMAQVDIPPATTEDIGNGDYAVSHAAYVMAYTTDNISHIVYPDGVTIADWVHDLTALAKNGWQGQ